MESRPTAILDRLQKASLKEKLRIIELLLQLRHRGYPAVRPADAEQPGAQHGLQVPAGTSNP